MQQDAFRMFLQGEPLKPGSVTDYVRYCLAVEKALDLDLDGCDLSPGGVLALTELLAERHGSVWRPKTISDYMSGVRRYAAFSGAQAGDRIRQNV